MKERETFLATDLVIIDFFLCCLIPNRATICTEGYIIIILFNTVALRAIWLLV